MAFWLGVESWTASQASSREADWSSAASSDLSFRPSRFWAVSRRRRSARLWLRIDRSQAAVCPSVRSRGDGFLCSSIASSSVCWTTPERFDLVAKRGVDLKPSQQGQVSPGALDFVGGKQRG